MNIEEMIVRCPDIIKVTPHIMSEISLEKFGCQLDFSKSWEDNGYDDLDGVEMVIELEKRLDIIIPDDFVECFERCPIPQFTQMIRSKKLDDLGI